MVKPGYYAVQSGRSTGVFKTWAECEESVKGFPNATYRKFDNEDGARNFVGAAQSRGHGSGSGSSRTYSGAYNASSLSSNVGYQSYSPPPSASRPAPASASHRDHHIFIDGAAPSNGREGSRAGYGIYHQNPAYQHLNRSERLQGDLQTNNRAELTAAVEALRDAPRDGRTVLHTDSRYTMGIQDWLPRWQDNGFRNASGQPVANQDLVRQLDQEMRSRNGNVEFQHVRGHTGVPGNEMADRLAVQGANKPRE